MRNFSNFKAAIIDCFSVEEILPWFENFRKSRTGTESYSRSFSARP